jgi:hypothetical protein
VCDGTFERQDLLAHLPSTHFFSCTRPSVHLLFGVLAVSLADFPTLRRPRRLGPSGGRSSNTCLLWSSVRTTFCFTSPRRAMRSRRTHGRVLSTAGAPSVRLSRYCRPEIARSHHLHASVIRASSFCPSSSRWRREPLQGWIREEGSRAATASEVAR